MAVVNSIGRKDLLFMQHSGEELNALSVILIEDFIKKLCDFACVLENEEEKSTTKCEKKNLNFK